MEHTLEEWGFSPHIINQTNNASKEASGTECTFFAPQRHSADQFPITCSNSPHFEEAAHWLYYRGTGRQGLIKLTGVITRPLPCHGSERRMEQRCDGEGHEAIIPQCAQWVFPVTPCRSRFKDWGDGPDSDGWWSAGDAHRADVPRCLRLIVHVSEEQFVLLAEALLRPQGEKGIPVLWLNFS